MPFPTSFARKAGVDASLFVLACAAGWVLFQFANHPWWHPHIIVDVVVFCGRAESFFRNGFTWELTMNEYQPGALWFFAGVMGLGGGDKGFARFSETLMFVNLALLALHIFLARAFVSRRAAWAILVFGFLIGPILLCRFELLVSFFVIVAWILWTRGCYNPAGFFIGVAIATKLYPVLFVPLLLVACWRERGFVRALDSLLHVAWGGLLVVGGLALFGSNLNSMLAAFRFHMDKPFGVEGLLGSTVPLLQYIYDIPLRMAPRNGIHGFEPDIFGAYSETLLGWIWVPFVIVVGALILLQKRADRCAPADGLFLFIGTYVLLGKLVAPQYAWWALPFLAFIPVKFMGTGRWIWSVALMGVTLLLSQIVYPLNYSEFLDSFKGEAVEGWIFAVNFTKNMLWLYVILLVSGSFLKRTVEARRLPSELPVDAEGGRGIHSSLGIKA
jgi:hypothetical protein